MDRFIDDSGKWRFDWRAHDQAGHPILSVAWSRILAPNPDYPPILIVDGVEYMSYSARPDDVLYRAVAPGPLVPGAKDQPAFRHEEI